MALLEKKRRKNAPADSVLSETDASYTQRATLRAAVKDTTRFGGEAGNWAYFSFGHAYPLEERARPQAVVNCSACHGANADDDFVFTQYYPVLRSAKSAAPQR